VIQISEKVSRLDVGHATNAEEVLAWALRHPDKFDRIIILSDMQTYGGNFHSYYWGHRRSGETVKSLIAKYRKTKNKDCKLHCIDMAGHGQSLTEQADTKTNLVAGFSEKLLDVILEFEGLASPVDPETSEPQQVFTIEMIREKF
jgi:hypothetical protein